MRMRKKKHRDERISACSDLLIENPEMLMNDPTFAFSDKSLPLALEIGCGKGNFAVGMAQKRHDINLIAMEKVPDVCCVALEKAMRQKDARPDNLRFVIGNADNLNEWFPEHSVNFLFLNFSDPWPKAGHAKRRLTHLNFLEKYKRIIKPGGTLYFKTDNEGLFNFSLEQFALGGLEVVWTSRDLHRSDRADGNIMTEYEMSISEKGFPIYMAEVRF